MKIFGVPVSLCQPSGMSSLLPEDMLLVLQAFELVPQNMLKEWSIRHASPRGAKQEASAVA